MTQRRKLGTLLGPEGILEEWPGGRALWMPVRGRSMFPVLRSGQALKIVACGANDVAIGDIAVGRLPGGVVAAHLIVQVEPARMSSFAGRLDPPETRIFGKAIAIRTRSGRVIPITPLTRRALILLQSAYCGARKSRVAPLLRDLRDGLTSPRTALLRRRLIAPVEVRLLGTEDLDELLVFTGDNSGLSAATVQERLQQRWQNQGRAAGAFSRTGKMIAFCYLDEYASEGAAVGGVWLRFLITSPMARGMGLAKRVVTELLAWAVSEGVPVVYADVLASNENSLRIFRSLGFHDVSGPVVQQIQDHHARSGNAGEWIVLEKELSAVPSNGG